MSGHSKWAKIKRAKGANDAKRGALFTRLARVITMSAAEGGGDPDMNFSLRLAIEKAKQANMPQDNIERAIKKGTGELEGGSISFTTYEIVTASGVGLLIDCATDNSNRSVSEIRNIVEGAGAKMGAIGSVSWQFAEQGEIEIGAAKLKKSEKFGQADSYVDADADELEELMMELPGIVDYEVFDPATEPDYEGDETRPASRKYITARVEKSELKNATDMLAKGGWQILESRIIKYAANKVSISEEQQEKLDNLLEQLEERDDIDSVWTNALN